MAQHGYLREYDEAWDRGDDRDRDRRRERGWDERDRSFMFSDRGREHDRGFFERMRDDARSWSRDDERAARGRDRDLTRSGRADWERSPRSFSSHQDDHYRSWRDRQVAALDRDYADYCREREEQFHQDFDNWRQRRSIQQPLRTGMTQTSQEVMDLTDEAQPAHAGETTTPLGGATLGTNSSVENTPGRGRR